MYPHDGLSNCISALMRMTARAWRSRSAILTAVALAVPVLGLAPSASAHTYTLRPVADTSVKQAFPNTNFGTSTSLTIRNGATGQTEHSFLRFSIPALEGNVTSATLTLRVKGAIQEAGYYSMAMGNPTWPETSLTWNNWATGTTFTYLGSQFNLPAGTNTSFDVTGSVGSSNVTFGVANSADVAGQSFASREAAVPPKLVIVTDKALGNCGTDDPGELKAELKTLLLTGNLLYACDYTKDLSPTFSAWSGGSENKPVVAAAIALFDGPVVNGTDYRIWWQNFFNQQASTTGSGHINYFKGSELFSNVYDASTTMGVLVARYWAQLNNHTTIKNLSADYLRRTWYAWALGTSSQAFTTVWRVQGTTRTQVPVSDPKQCPTLALASPRSKMYYDSDNKRWFLAKILGYNQTCYATADLKSIVNHVVLQYPDVSGLTSAQWTALRALINATTIPGDLASVLGVVRMERDYHWLLWSDGRRATYYLGHQLNNNVKPSGGKHTVFTAIFFPGTKVLDLLFKEDTGNWSCIEPSSRRVFADASQAACPSSTNWITLPPDNPTYHYVLGPNGWRTCSSLNC